MKMWIKSERKNKRINFCFQTAAATPMTWFKFAKKHTNHPTLMFEIFVLLKFFIFISFQGIIIHEFLHLLGASHEITRPDRKLITVYNAY